jgi:hypothetical protein
LCGQFCPLDNRGIRGISVFRGVKDFATKGHLQYWIRTFACSRPRLKIVKSHRFVFERVFGNILRSAALRIRPSPRFTGAENDGQHLSLFCTEYIGKVGHEKDDSTAGESKAVGRESCKLCSICHGVKIRKRKCDINRFPTKERARTILDDKCGRTMTTRGSQYFDLRLAEIESEILRLSAVLRKTPFLGFAQN